MAKHYEIDGVDCMAYCYGGSPKIVEADPRYPDPEFEWVKAADHEAEVARIEAVADTLDEAARSMADEFGNFVSTNNQSGAYREGKADAYALAAQQVRAALSDGGEGK